MTNTSIIIVNWNGREHLSVCLRSIYNLTFKQFEVIFVDNGSRDDSVGLVRRSFPQVKIIQAKKNFGFAEGNNIGIREAFKNPLIKYIVALNNDTEVAKDWLNCLVEAAERDSKVGAVCSKTLFFDQRDTIDSAGDFLLQGTLKVVTRGYKQKDRGQFDKAEECFSARACAALYRREMLEQTRLQGDYFDRHYFAYIEDSDLSIRARLMGWKIMYQPAAVVYHRVAATSRKISYLFRRYYSGRNRLFTAIKNYPVGCWFKSLKGSASVDTDYRLSIIEKLKVYVKIFFSLLMSWPRLLRQRRLIQQKKKIGDEEIKGWIKRFII